MSKTHELKCWPEYFEAMWDGRKTFDVRFNDRDYQEGDRLCLKEWKPAHVAPMLQEEERYTGRLLFCTISYVLRARDVASLGLIGAGCAVLGIQRESMWEEAPIGG